MSNSLDRLLDGIAAALRRDVIPRLDDEYATGQALAVIDLLNNLKPRIDWATPPLLARVAAQRALLEELDRLLEAEPERPRAAPADDETPADGRTLQALSERLDGLICRTVRWLGMRAGPAFDAARLAIDRHVRADLRQDMALTPRPLFSEIARGNDSTTS